jgi:hypothetical protein
MPACSARISPPVYAALRVRRSTDSEWVIGLQQNRAGVFYAPSTGQSSAANETTPWLRSSLGAAYGGRNWQRSRSQTYSNGKNTGCLPTLSERAVTSVHQRAPGHAGNHGVRRDKAAVINMAKTLSADLLEKGIRVNAISPGPITSALLARDGITQEKLQETKDWIQSQVPIKRFGTPEEIAAAVLYLTAPESAFVLGAELIIDGGMATL